MAYVVQHHHPPEPWSIFKRRVRHQFLLPFYFFNWVCEWAAYGLGRWSFLEVLEYIGSFSILIAVIFYFAGSGDRLKQKHYQAWQVINTAQGKGGSGGRIDALQELNQDHVPLIGVDVSDAYLQEINLRGADLRRGDLSGCDLRMAVFRSADLEGAKLHSANLRGADLTGTNLTDARFGDADLFAASLKDARVGNADFSDADLRGADLTGLRDWQSIKAIGMANIHGVQNPPPGFIDWARRMHAVDVEKDDQWERFQFPTTRGQPAEK